MPCVKRIHKKIEKKIKRNVIKKFIARYEYKKEVNTGTKKSMEIIILNTFFLNSQEYEKSFEKQQTKRNIVLILSSFVLPSHKSFVVLICIFHLRCYQKVREQSFDCEEIQSLHYFFESVTIIQSLVRNENFDRNLQFYYKMIEKTQLSYVPAY